ncbi:hypothetical protein ACQU0X_30865 [Pseudovibrio ascidiaceicola]|uniref:hypothetical protein n=1 Tax=Pseudovibrio ascidiaceicola TaxID=285279 RepID=UPI003D36DDF1
MNPTNENLSLIMSTNGQYAFEYVEKGTLRKMIGWTKDINQASVWPAAYIKALTADWDIDFGMVPACETRSVAIDTARMAYPTKAKSGRIPIRPTSLVGESSTGFLTSKPLSKSGHSEDPVDLSGSREKQPPNDLTNTLVSVVEQGLS